MLIKPKPDAIQNLSIFKAAERKDDPARMPDIRGPYEILHQRKYGRLPDDIWNLRVEESRSGLLWQSLSGMMDNYPDFAAAYIALALSSSLTAEEYRRELIALNKSWGAYLERENLTSDHHHSAMRGTYHRVSCVQCSTLTMLACQDPEIHDLFVKELLPLKSPQDRMDLLKEKGLYTLLDVMVPDRKPALDL